MITPGFDEAVDKYIAAFRSKPNFHKKTMDALAIMAGSKQGVSKFGDSVKAFNVLTELVESNDDEQFIIDEFYRMIFK